MLWFPIACCYILPFSVWLCISISTAVVWILFLDLQYGHQDPFTYIIFALIATPACMYPYLSGAWTVLFSFFTLSGSQPPTCMQGCICLLHSSCLALHSADGCGLLVFLCKAMDSKKHRSAAWSFLFPLENSTLKKVSLITQILTETSPAGVVNLKHQEAYDGK